MEIREKVVNILKEVNPAKRLDCVTDIFGGGYLDSFELIFLITQLNESFEIEISLDDLNTENFMSVDSITAMVKRMKTM